MRIFPAILVWHRHMKLNIQKDEGHSSPFLARDGEIFSQITLCWVGELFKYGCGILNSSVISLLRVLDALQNHHECGCLIIRVYGHL